MACKPCGIYINCVGIWWDIWGGGGVDLVIYRWFGCISRLSKHIAFGFAFTWIRMTIFVSPPLDSKLGTSSVSDGPFIMTWYFICSTLAVRLVINRPAVTSWRSQVWISLIIATGVSPSHHTRRRILPLGGSIAASIVSPRTPDTKVEVVIPC